jgi:hypothetical protein
VHDPKALSRQVLLYRDFVRLVFQGAQYCLLRIFCRGRRDVFVEQSPPSSGPDLEVETCADNADVIAVVL